MVSSSEEIDLPLLSDLTSVHAILNRDRAWAAYAIGDLSPGLVEHSEWRAPAGDAQALVLLYHGFTPPIAFAMGDPRYLRALFDEATAPTISLHLRPEALAAIADIYPPTDVRPMHRMLVRPADFAPASHEGVSRIREADLPAVAALYEDGQVTGEQPTFFHAAMLKQGSFRGIWENGMLVAIAGTHLFSRDLGICTIGNVYTRRDRRGRGLAARVTSAVVAHALDNHVATIVLNVSQENPTARRVYERLGFHTYCDFVEGEATRVLSS
jgi:GNAT superfamily N-acetyltransferase